MFQQFLDPSMTYSCAVFENTDKECVSLQELEEAQMRKIDRLLDMLELKPDDHVLEIGCGWGAAAIRGVQVPQYIYFYTVIFREVGANGRVLPFLMNSSPGRRRKSSKRDWRTKLNFGTRTTGDTNSWTRGSPGSSQLLFSIVRVISRLCTGKYSKIVSIEMIEAVGKDFLPQYFQTIDDRLKEGGIAVLQVRQSSFRLDNDSRPSPALMRTMKSTVSHPISLRSTFSPEDTCHQLVGSLLCVCMPL